MFGERPSTIYLNINKYDLVIDFGWFYFIVKPLFFAINYFFEITGNFLGYIKFKRQLSLSQKTLNFDKESIKVVKGVDSTGAIKVNGTLTIVGLADEFF